MNTRKKRAAALVLTVCACMMLAGCGSRDNETATEKTTVTKETNAADKNAAGNSATAQSTSKKKSTVRNNASGEKATGNKTAQNRTATDDDMVNSATSGRETNADGTYRESGMEEIGEGVGEVGEGIIHGAEDIVDDITGNGPAERNKESDRNDR